MVKTVLAFFALAYLGWFSSLAHANSTQVRRKKPLSINMHAAQNPIDWSGGSIAHNFGGPFEFYVRFLNGSADLKNQITTDLNILEDYSVNEASGKGVMASFGTRFFVDNSFSLLLGASYRRVEIRAGILNTNLNGLAVSNYRQENVLAYYGLGNQWSFDSGFVFGFDWIIVPEIGADRTSYQYSTNGLSSEQAAVFEKPMNRWMKSFASSGINPSIMTTIGWRF